MFRLERGLWGLHPAGYHVVNILLHAGNALLVWWVLRKLSIRGAWLAAALFALHPVQVESVAWITERKNVLSTALYLLALLSWMRFTDNDRRRWGFYALALSLYLLALFAKTTACTLPAALVLVLWWRRQKLDWRRALQIVPFVLAGLAMGLLAIWWERNRQGTQGDTFDLPFLQRLLIASRAIWFYLGKLLWPAHLCFSYPQWPVSGPVLRYYRWRRAWRQRGCCGDGGGRFGASPARWRSSSPLCCPCWDSSRCTPSPIPMWPTITSTSRASASRRWWDMP